ncbi:hypothetical protein D3C76_1140970 [compost metagenome]
MLQADRITADPGGARQVQRHLDAFGADARVQQVQCLVDHRGQVQPLAQPDRAVAGKGFQVAGERGHAREHLLQRLQGLAGLVVAAMVEQQAQGLQLHALGGQGLIDLVGHGG